MKKIISYSAKKIILLFTLLSLSVNALAYDFEVDKLRYSIISDTTVCVSGQSYWEQLSRYKEDYYNQSVSVEIVIPDHIAYNNKNYAVTEIGDSAFYCEPFVIYYTNGYCDLYIDVDIILPETVTYIGKNAFWGDFREINIYCYATIPPIMNIDSYNCGACLYVPYEAYSLYKELNDNNHLFSAVYIINGESSNAPVYKEVYFDQSEFGLRPYGCAVTIYPSENSVVYARTINYHTGMASENDIVYKNGWTRYENRDSIYFYYYADPNPEISGTKPDGWLVEFYVVEDGKNPSYSVTCGRYSYDFPVGKYFDFIDSGIAYNIRGDAVEVTSRKYWISYGGYGYGYDYTDDYSGDIVIPKTATCRDYADNESITYPVSSIGSEAFYLGYYVTSVTIPESINSIGDMAFYDCRNLIQITCLATVPPSTNYNTFNENIYENATLIVPYESIQAYRNAPDWCNFSRIISYYSFEYEGLRYRIIGDFEVALTDGEEICISDVVIPAEVTYQGVTYSVTRIDGRVFYNNENLNTIVLPATINTIASEAFYNCPNLTQVTCLAIEPPSAEEYSFDDFIYVNTTLKVPYESIHAYGSNSGWWNFGRIVSYDFECEGFYYRKINDNEVILTAGNTLYFGDVTVPTEVVYQGVIYTVTGIDADAILNYFNYDYYPINGLTIPVTINYVGEIENYYYWPLWIADALYLTGEGEWHAGSTNYHIPKLFIGSGVTGMEGMRLSVFSNYINYSEFESGTIYSYASTPPRCDENTFNDYINDSYGYCNCYDAELHVPASSVAAYFTAPIWCYFTNIIGDAVELNDLSVENDSVHVLLGGQTTLNAVLNPVNATPNEVIWTSSDNTVAKVVNGVVTGVKTGECDIVATCQNKRAVCHVFVTEVQPTSVTLSQEFAKLEIGAQLTLTATVLPDSATNKTVTWATTNSAVATVANGVVTAIAPGECFITATCGECQTMCHVIVVEQYIYITLDQHDVAMLPNHIITLTPTVTPVSTSLVVSSSDPSVAAVRLANGKIQVVGVSEGTAVISVNSVDGYAESDSCIVTVYTEIGDVNGDGYVNVTDVTVLLNCQLTDDMTGINFGNADVNHDNVINITDVTILINHLLSGIELEPNNSAVPYGSIIVNSVALDCDTFQVGAPIEQESDGTLKVIPSVSR